VCLAIALAACGGGGGGGGGGGSNLGATGLPVRLVYASTYQSASSSTAGGGLYAFRFDPNSGRLSVVSSTPFGAETAGAPIAISRDGKFLYSIDFATNQNALAAFAIQTDGFLVSVPAAPFDAGEPIAALATNPAADFLYAIAMSGDLKVYSIDAATGALTPRSTVSAPAAGGNALITPGGRFLYDTTTNGIYEFSIDAATGALTQLVGSPVAYHVVPGPGVIHPSGKFLYITNADPSVTSNAQLSAWSIDSQTGELGAISLSPSAVTAGPQQSVTIDGSGQFAMVTTAASAGVSAGCFYELGIDASTGALAPVPGVGSAIECGPIAADASYNFLYDGSSGVAVYLLSQQGVPQLVTAGVLFGLRVTNIAAVR
jgi:DNA-binding beta-propeller fold protein YncE